MPFKSEKQKRYLWANEPEIARDWTDTYGSRIKKNDGGIMRVGLKKGSGPAGGASAGGNYGGDSSGGSYSAGAGRSEAQGGQFGDSYGPGRNVAGPVKGAIDEFKAPAHIQREEKAYRESIVEKHKAAKKKKESFRGKIYQSGLNRNKVESMRQLNLMRPGMRGLWGKLISGVTGKVPEWAEDLTEAELMQIATSGPYLSQQKTKGDASKFGRGKDLLGRVTEGQDLLNKGDLTQSEWERLFPGNIKPPTGGEGQGGGYMGYPSYAAWQAAQGRGGSGGITTATAANTPSAFQQSLTTTADTPDYYVGDNPLASNLAWGKTYGVDPRTMGRTSWAADGGRIGRAYGGIMDSSTGRRAYGFGSIFSKIGKAAKKVFKSPIGKAALVAGGFGLAGMGPFKGLQGTSLGTTVGGWFGKQGPLAGLVRKKLADTATTGIWGAPSWAKIGIGAAGALPFFMGGGDEDEDEGFDYEGAKNKYWDELMRIKSGAMAGSLDPTKFNYLGAKDGGRIGLYAGGQSTPSDYTMEDAMMTTTQDKLGGITDVMKQADLSRQGSVGQFYAAQGGRIGYDEGGPSEIGGDNISEVLKRVQELEDEGLDFGAAMAQAMKELSQGKAHGGRIGAEEGGLMDLGGMEKDYRNDGGFVPLGGEEKADDVPARLSKNEFVFTADAVRGAGEGDIDKGAEIMENIMKNLEQGGKISEETQGNTGAQEMFSVSERLGEVI